MMDLWHIYDDEYYIHFATYTYDTELERRCRYIFGRLHSLERILLASAASNLPSQSDSVRSGHRTVKKNNWKRKKGLVHMQNKDWFGLFLDTMRSNFYNF